MFLSCGRTPIINICWRNVLVIVEIVMRAEMNVGRIARLPAVGLMAVLLAGCESASDGAGIVDGGFDTGPLRDGVANVWVDPDGCQHWVIDDGIEGYMSPRLNRDGTPRCNDSRGEVVMKDGTSIVTEPEPTIPTS